ncbi:MAG TPA: hypothetical protein VGB53_14570 [Rubricoccaceae bacterium]|jgi:hypothetical protein
MPSVLPAALRLTLLLAAVVAAVPSAGCQSIRSDLSVPARETFVLGGDAGSFRVSVTNTGPVAVTLVERAADGTETPRGRLAPRARAEAVFAAGSAALVVNASGREARLEARITGQTEGLGMRYVPTAP